MKATFNGVVIAESNDTKVVEGNHYFPRESVAADALARTDHTTVCGWKGTSNYFTVTAGGSSAKNAAWTYETPLDAAAEIKDHVAFYASKVTVSD